MTVLAFFVLPELQIGIDHVVHRMQLFVRLLGFLCDTQRHCVGVDRLLPVPDACEDVRRHVLGVRGARSDLGVEPGGFEAFVGQRRRVVEMDQVVRDAGMARAGV